jgi:mono/diheme cytochrome c family protein
MRRTLLVVALGIMVVAGLTVLHDSLSAQGMKAKTGGKSQVEHGAYLVQLGGCNDCHSPKMMGPKGPVLHPTKILSGHPADAKLPPLPQGVVGPQAWGAITTNDLTAWVGPWGTSFAANLTPDPASGIGGWTEEMFIKTLRTGKHLGTGREILPPMPWQGIGQSTDQDLKDIFAYLKSLPPVANVVPQPIPPGGKSN